MPSFADSWRRRLSRAILRMAGWRLAGELPDIPQAVLIGVPHSSWWDGIWGLLMKVAMGADVHFMAKQELFRGPLGALLRQLGGVGIDRSATKGVVEQMVDQFATHPKFWLGITPEGTRKQVERWKSGFWHIARRANVPVVPVYFHYPDRVIGLGPIFETSDDMEADLVSLRQFFTPFQGKHRGV
nr:lysophospholipid acyltransferase family protein [Oleiagrimonas sp. C23AA]